MSQAVQEAKASKGRAERRPRTARATRLSVAQQPEGPAVPPVLTPEEFRQIGRTLNGEHWQADVAFLIGCSKSQVTRYLNRTRDLNPLIAKHLQYVIVERISQLVELMDLPGMPYAGSADVQKVIPMVQELVQRLPGQEPPMDRYSPPTSEA